MTASTRISNGAVALGAAPVGFAGRIEAIRVVGNDHDLPSSELERRLIELGFVEGARVKILHEGLFGRDPIAVRVNEATVALRRRGGIEIGQPRVAFRRVAAAAARAIRVAERQPHLEGKICAQKVRKLGAVGAKDESHLVFAEAQIVEQEIARSIAQHLVQSRPR